MREPVPYYYIIYDRTAPDRVKALCRTFESAGIRCWYAGRDADDPSDADEIARAILQAKGVILYLTKNAWQSPNVRNELSYAAGNGLRIFLCKEPGADVSHPALRLSLSDTRSYSVRDLKTLLTKELRREARENSFGVSDDMFSFGVDSFSGSGFSGHGGHGETSGGSGPGGGAGVLDDTFSFGVDDFGGSVADSCDGPPADAGVGAAAPVAAGAGNVTLPPSAAGAQSAAAVICPHCGAKLNAETRFCTVCGHEIGMAGSGAKAPSPASAARPPMPSPGAPAPAAGRPPEPSPPAGRWSLRNLFRRGKKPEPAPAPLQPLSRTNFSVLSPRVVRPDSYGIVDLYMYTEQQRAVVDKALAEAGGLVKETSKSGFKVAHASSITVRLESPDAEIADGMETQVWNGEALHFDFRFHIAADYPRSQAAFTCYVECSGIPVTRLSFLVAVAEAPDTGTIPAKVTRTDYRKAFISYSRKDEQRMLARVLSIQEMAPELCFWLDRKSMDAGDLWREEIRKAINISDVLLLFWSVPASRSAEVEKEWRYAYDEKGLTFISPVPLDPPELCPPPEMLNELNFNVRAFSEGEITKKLTFYDSRNILLVPSGTGPNGKP